MSAEDGLCDCCGKAVGYVTEPGGKMEGPYGIEFYFMPYSFPKDDIKTAWLQKCIGKYVMNKRYWVCFECFMDKLGVKP